MGDLAVLPSYRDSREGLVHYRQNLPQLTDLLEDVRNRPVFLRGGFQTEASRRRYIPGAELRQSHTNSRNRVHSTRRPHRLQSLRITPW